jgi:hypothetical protein
MLKKDKNIRPVLVRKSEGKRSVKRPRHGWKENIRMGLKGMRSEYVN